MYGKATLENPMDARLWQAYADFEKKTSSEAESLKVMKDAAKAGVVFISDGESSNKS